MEAVGPGTTASKTPLFTALGAIAAYAMGWFRGNEAYLCLVGGGAVVFTCGALNAHRVSTHDQARPEDLKKVTGALHRRNSQEAAEALSKAVSHCQLPDPKLVALSQSVDDLVASGNSKNLSHKQREAGFKAVQNQDDGIPFKEDMVRPYGFLSAGAFLMCLGIIFRSRKII